MELTLFMKENGPLSKSISLDPQTGEPASDSSECYLGSGWAARLPLANVHELAHVLANCPSDAALALGSLVSTVVPADGQRMVGVVTARRLAKLQAGAATSVIARTLDFLEFRPGTPGFMLLDLDFKGMPADVAARIKAAGGPLQAIAAAIPGLAKAGRVTRLSTSAGLSDSTTGRTFPSSGGTHNYLPVTDADDIPRAVQNIFDRLWLDGLGWARVSTAGSVLLRTPVDAAVGSPERLVFEGAPGLVPPLVQDNAARMPQVLEGPAIDTRLVLPPLTELERQTVNIAQAEARRAVATEAAAKRYATDKRLAEALATATGMPLANAIERVGRRHRGELMPEAELVFDDQAIGTITVAAVMAEPASFVGETLADPLEGPAYGRCKAKVMRGNAGEIIIHSFVHGGSTWRLFHDEKSLTAFVGELPERFLAGFADAMQDLMDDEAAYERLRQMAIERTGGKARLVNNALKKAAAARKAAKAAAARATGGAETDRAIMPAPFHNSERRKTVLPIDRVLGKDRSARRILRGRNGRLVTVRKESQVPHFGLADEDDLDENGKPMRKELPKSWGIDELSEVGIQMAVENFICLLSVTGKGDPVVALPIPFCMALNALPIEDSLISVIHGIQTMPLVIDRNIVAPEGFDEALGIWFAIPPELRDILPNESECTFEAVKREYEWLCDEWLCDVAATTEGKAAAIALACTGIVRHVVRVMPIFLARAGQHGTGKTTLLNMIATALTGRVASAAAWSTREEERRKALFAYMMNDAAMLVFDNIWAGTQIDCPHLAKYVTAGSIVDRELGVSIVRELSATTVVCLTGNSVMPSGDLAPRILTIDLHADRTDPRNRDVRREDPIAFTRSNRRHIFRALCMILCLDREKAAKAGMWAKAWWHAVGHPIELLAGVSFKKMLATNEEIDEKAVACGQLFSQLRDIFGPDWFRASDVRRELLDPEHGVPPFMSYMPDALQQQRYVKRLAVDDFRGLLEAATSSGRGLPPGVPNAERIGHRLIELNQRVAGHDGAVLKLDMRPDKKLGNQYRIVVLSAATNGGVVDDAADTANGDATTGGVQADAETDSEAAVNGGLDPLTYEEILARITEAMAEDALAT